MLEALSAAGVVQLPEAHGQTLATGMSVVVTYWLSYEYVRNPRHAMAPESASQAMGRGAQHVLGLLLPYLSSPQLQQHLAALTSAYAQDAQG